MWGVRGERDSFPVEDLWTSQRPNNAATTGSFLRRYSAVLLPAQHLRRCVESCQFFAQLAGAGDAALERPFSRDQRRWVYASSKQGNPADHADPAHRMS